MLTLGRDQSREKVRGLLKRAIEILAKDAYERILHKREVKHFKPLDRPAADGSAAPLEHGDAGSVSCLPEAPTVHRTPVKVEPLPCFGILKQIVRPDLFRHNKAGHETRLLTVDQSVCAAVPRSPPALNEAKQMNQKGYMRHVVHDVGDFVIVGSHTVLLDVVAPGGDFLITRLILDLMKVIYNWQFS